MILLTGATGYIGSHLWIELLNRSMEVIGLDNLSNSDIERLDAIANIAGVNPTFIKGDIRDKCLLDDVFSKYQITEVIHLAALKDIEESMHMQSEYFEVNVRGLENLLEVMRSHNCYKLIFSSSAAVYGARAISPISESTESLPSNYYGETKLRCEQLLATSFKNSLAPITFISLRYFNVSGWHETGLLHYPISPKSHSLFSEIQRVLSGDLAALPIFGDDWDTPDGTCIRDYLHISDLVRGHIDALMLNGVCKRINLGSGHGRSVREVIHEYEQVTGISIPTVIKKRRDGDVAISFADVSLAAQELNWKPLKTLKDICLDSHSACRHTQLL